MTPIQAPSAAIPAWVFIAAVLILAAVVVFGVVLPLRTARTRGLAVSFSRQFDQRDVLRPLWVGVGFLVLLVVLAIAATQGLVHGLDDSVHDFFVGQRTGVLSAIAVVVTNAGSPFGSAILLIALAVFMARRTASWTPPLILLVGPMVTGLINTGIKYTLRRERPLVGDQLVVTTDPSFPSGHMAWSVATWGCIAIAVILVFNIQHAIRVIAVCTIVPLLVMLTRLYLGVHYLSDLLAAASLGAAAVALTLAAYRWNANHRAYKAA